MKKVGSRNRGKKVGRPKKKSKVNLEGYTTQKVKSLPKNPKKGTIYEITVNAQNGKRKVGFIFTGKKGFGMWRVVYNRPA